MPKVTQITNKLPKTYFQAIGEIIAVSSFIDWRLVVAMQYLMGLNPKQARTVGIKMAASAKIAIVHSYAQNWCQDGKARKNILSACAKYKSLLNDRNAVAHGIWSHPSERKLAIVYMTEGKHFMLPVGKYRTSAHLRETTKELKEALKLLDAGISILKSLPSPSPDKSS